MKKLCKKCGKIKSLDLFNKDSTIKSGYHSLCKDCKYDLHKLWLEKNPTYMKNYNSDNSQKIKECKYNWVLENQEKIKAQQRCHKIKVEKGFEKHHWNYNENYQQDVIIIESWIHKKIHTKIYYDKKLLIYRCKETGIKLDKEDHIRLAKEIRNYAKS